MPCPYCEAGVSSTVTVTGTNIHVGIYQHYYDDAGFYHSHDSTVTTTRYECSRGHAWEDTAGMPCACGWSPSVPERVRIA